MTSPSSQPALRIGVLGAAKITGMALIDPAKEVDGVEVTAIAARDPQRAAEYAATHGIGSVHGTYEDLLADESIDAVYVPLPAALHAEWTIASALAGKHVLTEKPFTSNAAAAQDVADRTSGADVVVMEAYHTHYHPAVARLKEIIASGEIGTITSAKATFHNPHRPSQNIRWNLALGGGTLLDLGYYPVRMLTELFGEDPEIASAWAAMHGDIDRHVTAELAFPGGVRGQVDSSMWAPRMLGASLRIVGTEGTISMPFPYHPQFRKLIRVRGRDGKRVERVSARSTYAFQLEAFRDTVRGTRENETGVAAAVRNMRTLDAIYAAAGVALRP